MNDAHPPTRRFEGKIALVTGGNSGIGRAVARGLAAEGARVVIAGRNAATVAAVAGELDALAVAGSAPSSAGAAAPSGHSVAGHATCALGVVADCSRLDEIDRLITATAGFAGGRLDIVFANAGIATFGSVASTTEAQWDALMGVNLKGVYFTVQKALALMGEGGAIVLNASVAAGKGNPAGSLYGASKAGVRSLGRTLAAELVARRIRVNVVSPGPIETPLFDRVGGMTPSAVDDMEKAWAERNPMKRFGTPDEVAATVLFLASDAASYITGVDLLVDGGLGSF